MKSILLKERKYLQDNNTSKIILYIVLIIHTFVVLFPIYVMFVTSLKNEKEIFLSQVSFPKVLCWENYTDLFAKYNYLYYLRNSMFVTLSSVVLLLVISSFAAYVLAKYKFKLNKLIYFYFFIGIMIPIRLGTINIFQMMKSLNLFDNLLSLIIIYTTMSLPIGIFILTDFVRVIPDSIIEAARIDGSSEFWIYRSIVIPLIRPGLVTVAVFNFLPIWNDFWFGLVLIRSDKLKTVPLATTMFYGEYFNEYGLIFAALSMASLPLILFYLILSRQFVKGLIKGAVKG